MRLVQLCLGPAGKKLYSNQGVTMRACTARVKVIGELLVVPINLFPYILSPQQHLFSHHILRQSRHLKANKPLAKTVAILASLAHINCLQCTILWKGRGSHLGKFHRLKRLWAIVCHGGAKVCLLAALPAYLHGCMLQTYRKRWRSQRLAETGSLYTRCGLAYTYNVTGYVLSGHSSY